MRLTLGDISVQVTRKDIKNVHLSVYPPEGAVRVSAPVNMSDEAIRLFVIAQLGWIKRQRKKLQGQEREAPREYIERESHYLWGRRYLLELRELDAPPDLRISGNRMILSARPGTPQERLAEITEAWYRSQLRESLEPLLEAWLPRIGARVERLFVQHMKTKWGSCNPLRGHIRLNTELAKKPRECLEYIVVHELVHFLEPGHDERFVALMDRYLPQWRNCRAVLNRLPIKHEEWKY
jgi:predicted metal-dependent hydrolase